MDSDPGTDYCAIIVSMNRENYLRVTEVLYPFSGLNNVDADVLRRAADRGTKVHKICEGIAAGLGEYGVDDEAWGYVESFKQWWGEGRKVTSMEERFWDDDLCFTGQVDFILDEPEGLVIADLKTSSAPSKTWVVQGCAYAYLAKNAGYNVAGIQFIHLNKHGKAPKVHRYDFDDGLFFACLRVFLHFFAKGEQWNELKSQLRRDQSPHILTTSPEKTTAI